MENGAFKPLQLQWTSQKTCRFPLAEDGTLQCRGQRHKESVVPTSDELVGVEYLDHLVPPQLVGPVLEEQVVPAPKDPALAQPLDEDALLVAVQEDAPFQVPKELPRDLLLAVIGDGVSGREPDVLQAVGADLLAVSRGLAEGDPAAFGVGGCGVANQLPTVVEADHHLTVGCGETRRHGLSADAQTISPSWLTATHGCTQDRATRAPDVPRMQLPAALATLSASWLSTSLLGWEQAVFLEKESLPVLMP